MTIYFKLNLQKTVYTQYMSHVLHIVSPLYTLLTLSTDTEAYLHRCVGDGHEDLKHGNLEGAS